MENVKLKFDHLFELAAMYVGTYGIRERSCDLDRGSQPFAPFGRARLNG